MQIIEYFEAPEKEKWRAEIERCDWSAARFLGDLLKENRFEETLGKGGKLYLMTDGGKLVSFVTLTRQDCIEDAALSPWLGFLFTVPEYRGHRYSQELMEHACGEAKKAGYEKVYLATDHVGLYEKYGFTYRENRVDVWGEDSRIYEKSLSRE